MSDFKITEINPVNPQHYNKYNIEPWDAIADWGLNFDRGSAVKYIVRAGDKDDYVQDMKKAIAFIEHDIAKHLEKEGL